MGRLVQQRPTALSLWILSTCRVRSTPSPEEQGVGTPIAIASNEPGAVQTAPQKVRVLSCRERTPTTTAPPDPPPKRLLATPPASRIGKPGSREPADAWPRDGR